ncbi:hypothetical protein ACQP3C_29835, partial [Escherichia coli]
VSVASHFSGDKGSVGFSSLHSQHFVLNQLAELLFYFVLSSLSSENYSRSFSTVMLEKDKALYFQDSWESF